MLVNSPLLLRQLEKTFGAAGAARLLESLASRQGLTAEQVDGLAPLLQLCDGTYSMYTRLRQQQSLLSGDSYSDWNLQSGAIESGQQWKKLLGYAPDAVADTVPALQNLAHPDDLAVLRARIAAHIDGRTERFAAECRMRAADGHWHWLLLSGLLTRRTAAGEALRMLVMCRDIMALKNAESACLAATEAAAAANQVRGDFLSNMSHEIRTPLNGIIGMTDLALDTSLDAEQRQYLKTVKSSAESLLGIVSNVLDFSRIEAGKLTFDSIAFSVPDLVLETSRVLAVAAHKKGLEIIVNVDDDVPSTALGDPARLRQILSNLLANAVKFTEHGEIVVDVGVEKSTPGSLFLRFAVRDTGIGISAAKQAGLFEAFAQADVSSTRRYGGAGLGLAICSRLARLMDGRIWLESTEHEGSAFFLSARFGVAPGLAPAPRALVPAALKGKRALVVAANRELGRQLRDLLARLGVVAATFAEDAPAIAALEQARRLGTPYDFVLLDAARTGVAAFCCAENGDDGAPKEKLITLLTTASQQQSLAKRREPTAGASLVKPVGAGDLLDALVLAQKGDEAPAGETAFALDPFVLEQPNTTPGLDILLVDDNPVNRETLRRLLETLGHRVALANNGAEAVDRFAEQRFDVILMDLEMPIMGGVEATEAIRAKEMRRTWISASDVKQIYIIALTANALGGDWERCRDAGIDDYVAKPVAPGELCAALERSVSAHEESCAEQAANPAPDPMVLNLRLALENLGDRDLLMHMVRMMLTDWDSHLEKIVAALDRADPNALLMHTFTLKSLLAMFHAEDAHQMAAGLEKLLADNAAVDFAKCSALVERLQASMVDLKRHMQRFVATGLID